MHNSRLLIRQRSSSIPNVIAQMRLLHLNVVLAAVAGDESSVNVLRGAHELAMAAGATLHVVHVGSHAGSRDRFLADAGLSTSDAQLHVLDGEAADAIRSLGDRIHADVIILGRHRGRAGDQPPMGSTALAVVSSSWAPCLILTQPLRLPLERVLVPVDLSDTSRGALVIALSWASALRRGRKASGPTTHNTAVDLTALHVERVLGDHRARPQTRTLYEELSHIRRDAGRWADVAINGAVVANDDVALAIADYAREHHADLVVLGTRGSNLNSEARLGSVSLGILRRVASPVLLVPPAVWISYAAASKS